MLLKTILSSLLFFSMQANAQIVCSGKTKLGSEATVSISEDVVLISSKGLTSDREITDFDRVNGLITAPGLAIQLNNHYGCWSDVTIISEFVEPLGAGYMEVIKVAKCTGGSTPDDICLKN